MILARVLVAGLLGIGIGVGGARAQADPCEAPDEAAGSAVALPHVAAALKPGSTLNVLAVGSATLFGPEAAFLEGTVTRQEVAGGRGVTAPVAQALSGPPSELAFPSRMARAIEAAVPGVKVTVTARGGRGFSAAEMLNLIRSGVGEKKYELVMWQTGTIEAVRNTPPGEFAETLAQGAETVAGADADLVLIDPQFSRFLQTNSNLDPYEQAFQQVASMPGVLLFRRFDLMRNWANEGRIDLERTPKPSRHEVVEHLHACLGAHLARLIVTGARS